MVVSRRAPARPALETVKVELEGDTEIIDLSFFDDDELALVVSRGATRALKTHRSSVADKAHWLATFALSSLEWGSTQPLTFSRAHKLGGTGQTPLAFALNGRAGRRVGCVLGGDGRTMTVLDMEQGDEDEDEAVDDAIDDDADVTVEPMPKSSLAQDEDIENDDAMQL